MPQKTKAKKPVRTCADCIHEWACQAWTLGGRLSETNADRCKIYETVRDSAAYFIGYREGLEAGRCKHENA
jgi:hypothetical protein